MVGSSPELRSSVTAEWWVNLYRKSNKYAQNIVEFCFVVIKSPVRGRFKWFVSPYFSGLIHKHDDVINGNIALRRYWRLVKGIHRSPVDFPHRGQWGEALVFSVICYWTNSWANNLGADDLRRRCAHYYVTVVNNKAIVRLTRGAS